MQRAGGDPIRIWHVPAGDGSQAHEVDVGILGDQRIKGPFDQADTTHESVFPLKQLQSPADTAIAVTVEDCRHVRVEERFAGTPSRNRQRKSNQPIAFKSPEDLPSRLRGDNKQRDGNDIDIGRLPNRSLDLEASLKFHDSVAGSDQNPILNFRP